MDDGIGLAEALLGLDGFRVLDVDESPAELVVTVETTADFVGCPSCGVRAEAQDRLRVDLRDLPCFGRPARLVWLKRRWRCVEADCPARTWTERHPRLFAPRAVLTLRAGTEATRQVGELAHAGRLCRPRARRVLVDGDGGSGLHGTPLVEDP